MELARWLDGGGWGGGGLVDLLGCFSKTLYNGQILAVNTPHHLVRLAVQQQSTKMLCDGTAVSSRTNFAVVPWSKRGLPKCFDVPNVGTMPLRISAINLCLDAKHIAGICWCRHPLYT